ncbi:hypothetical protein CEXT_567361 [Caerostris extrusa]|uniref:Uncharacterized protein n=1 Tax=Caerostris extrusa TaxID=172846 RepID=A0AAV4V5X7_CAEEX|nr:hypothetical protein CEXT_567361 [Caerostris extrusa]
MRGESNVFQLGYFESQHSFKTFLVRSLVAKELRGNSDPVINDLPNLRNLELKKKVPEYISAVLSKAATTSGTQKHLPNSHSILRPFHLLFVSLSLICPLQRHSIVIRQSSASTVQTVTVGL